jgi:hypothetical protein
MAKVEFVTFAKLHLLRVIRPSEERGGVSPIKRWEEQLIRYPPVSL